MLTTLLLLALQTGQATPAPTAEVLDLIHFPRSISAQKAAQYERLLHDIDDHALAEAGQRIAYATDAEQQALKAAGLSFSVQIENLTEYYAARAAADQQQSRLATVGSMGGFRTLAEIEQEMDRLATTFPQHCSTKFSIGQSIEGRSIWAMRISTTPSVHDPAKATAWYDAIHHSREPMSGESVLMFANEVLSNYGSDPLATRLVETRNLLFIPCVNPDGYEYNRQIAPNGGGMWRKNRRNNGGGTFGVDLNRNYAYEWGPQWSGSSSNPSSDTYRGASPESEPETQAMVALLSSILPGMSMSVHSYGNLMLIPYGYTTLFTPDDAHFRDIGSHFVANSGWALGTVWELLYTANGGNMDTHYGTYGITAFSPEVGSNSDGFWPAPSRINQLYSEVRESYFLTAQWTGGWAQAGDLQWTELIGDGDAYRDPGETWQLSLSVSNPGEGSVQVTADLADTSSFVSVSGGPLALSINANDSSPAVFTVQFAANAPIGTALGLDLSLTFDGLTDVSPIEVFLGRERNLLHDDFEQGNFGWSANPQVSNWAWELANPQQTTSSGQTVQPENDATPGAGTLCWVTGASAGGSVGTNDVDGTAILLSPIFDLSEFSQATLEYTRWFANLPGGPLDDRFLAEISADGGSTWTTLEDIGNRNQWQVTSFPLEGVIALSNQMRLRITVADDPNDDITEGLLDTFTVRVRRELPTLSMYGNAAAGSTVRFEVDGEASASFQVAWAGSRGAGTTLPGFDGLLEVINPQVFASGSCGTDGRGSVSLTLPGGASGRTLHFQAVVGLGTPSAALTNAQSVSFP